MITSADGWWAIYLEDGVAVADKVAVWFMDHEGGVYGLVPGGASPYLESTHVSNFVEYSFGSPAEVSLYLERLNTSQGKEETMQSETKPTEDEESTDGQEPEAPADETPDEPKEEEPAEA